MHSGRFLSSSGLRTVDHKVSLLCPTLMYLRGMSLEESDLETKDFRSFPRSLLTSLMNRQCRGPSTTDCCPTTGANCVCSIMWWLLHSRGCGWSCMVLADLHQHGRYSRSWRRGRQWLANHPNIDRSECSPFHNRSKSARPG